MTNENSGSPADPFVKTEGARMSGARPSDDWELVRTAVMHVVLLLGRAEALAAVERLEAAMRCDVCAGTGKVASAESCICGGSGRLDDAFRNLRVEYQGQSELKDAARDRWIDCQNRLAEYERLAIQKIGIEQGLPDNIEHMAAELERLEAERQSDTFLIYFADPDMRPEVYYGGGAERAARHRLEALNLNWDVTLFAAIKSTKESANE